MKKSRLLAVCMMLSGLTQTEAQTQTHSPRCGLADLQAAMIAKDPSWKDRFAAQKAAMQGIADDYIAKQKSGEAERTATQISPVPVIFHIVVDSAQFNLIGGTAGIAIRCDSQIAVLNRDFNRQNPDSTEIPSGWKSLYGNVGIHFGLARVDPNGNCSPGYEVKIIAGNSTSDAGFSDESDAFKVPKTAATGLAAWDVTKYYNVWCINFTGSAHNLLGITEPKSFVTASTVNLEGVCISYDVLGCTAWNGTPPPNTGSFEGWPIPYNLGRTLTHETGHFFEIWHPWGDDGGQCPTWSATDTVNGIICVAGAGSDDGLSDTPPESDAVYGNPAYSVPGGTENDCCQWHGSVNTQPIGIACLSYMDYSNDNALHLFTPMEAASMASMVLVPPGTGTGAKGYGTVGENYNLTQNPQLLVACPTSVPTTTAINSELNIFPNPTTGQVTITLNSAAETLNQIIVINLLGQEVMTVNGQNKDFYTLDLSGIAKGIYIIKCNFASGSVTRKILLQ